MNKQYFYVLIIFMLTDSSYIFSTFLDFIVFMIVYTFHSITHADRDVITDYIKLIIETEISYTSSTFLKKNELF